MPNEAFLQRVKELRSLVEHLVDAKDADHQEELYAKMLELMEHIETLPKPWRPSLSLAGKRVLLVERDLDALVSMSFLLRSAGASVDVTGDGQAARAAMEAASYDAVVVGSMEEFLETNGGPVCMTISARNQTQVVELVHAVLNAVAANSLELTTH
jgi:CheY-like chemotaxis protein